MYTTTTLSRQAGSVATFIIAGAVLLALTLGGVYIAKQRGMVASTKSGQETKQQTQETSKDKPAEKPQNSNASENGQNQPQPDMSKPAPTATPTPPPAETPRTGGQQQSQVGLPATGPEDRIMVSTLAIIALTYSGLHFIQSHRKLSR